MFSKRGWWKTYPWSSSPPEGTRPDILVLLHISEHSLDGSLALAVVAASKLSDEALLAVILKPLGSGRDTLLADGAGDASLVSAAAIAVEVLVHLVDELVLGILESSHGFAVLGGRPSPGTSPRVALSRDVLAGSTSSTDTVDTSLVKVDDKGLVHVVELVVDVEDDFAVAGEFLGDVGPPSLETRGVGDDLRVEAWRCCE